MPSGEGTKQAISSWILKSQLQVQLLRKVEGCSKENRVLHKRAPVLYDNDFRLANPPFFPLPALSCPVTMQFILGLLLAPTFGAFFSILPIFTQGQAQYHEKKGISLMKILTIFSHPGTKNSQHPFHAESENVQNCLCPSPSTEGWNLGCFSQSEGSRQITVICVSSFSGRAECLFHLGNNRFLATPPMQTQAAGEQQEQKSLVEV